MRRRKRRVTLTQVLIAAKNKHHPTKKGITKSTSRRMRRNTDERFENFFEKKKPRTEQQHISSMLRSLAQHVIETGKMPDASFIASIAGSEVAEQYRATDPARLVKVIGEHLIDATASLDFGSRGFGINKTDVEDLWLAVSVGLDDELIEYGITPKSKEWIALCLAIQDYYCENMDVSDVLDDIDEEDSE